MNSAQKVLESDIAMLIWLDIDERQNVRRAVTAKWIIWR